MTRATNKVALAAVFSAAVLAAPAVWPAHAEPRDAGRSFPAQRPGGEAAEAKPESPGAGTGRQRVAQPQGKPANPKEDWAVVSGFMSQYMPWRINEVQQMREGPAKDRIKNLLTVRYRGLRALQGRDPEGFVARLGQLKVEDQVYKLVSELPGADAERRQQIRDELRSQVQALVDVDLSERKRRVERLEQELSRQKKLLDQDTRDHDTIVERRLSRFLDWGSRWPARRGPGAKPDKSTAKPQSQAPAGKAGEAAPDGDLDQ